MLVRHLPTSFRSGAGLGQDLEFNQSEPIHFLKRMETEWKVSVSVPRSLWQCKVAFLVDSGQQVGEWTGHEPEFCPSRFRRQGTPLQGIGAGIWPNHRRPHGLSGTGSDSSSWWESKRSFCGGHTAGGLQVHLFVARPGCDTSHTVPTPTSQIRKDHLKAEHLDGNSEHYLI